MSTGRGGLRVSLCLALLCIGALVAGCGGGSSSSGSSSTTSSGSGTASNTRSWKDEGNPSIPKFGEEAPAEEREAVSTLVSESLEARADGDFVTQCETLSAKAIAKIPGAKNRADCATQLKRAADPLSKTKAIREDTLKGSIAELRIKGEKGYALYHGTDGQDYAIPLEKEDGNWKVGSVLVTVI
jgi:hypothetical protein